MGLDWEWQSVDGCMMKVPLGRAKPDPQNFLTTKSKKFFIQITQNLSHFNHPFLALGE
jgi:hypothetical protein